MSRVLIVDDDWFTRQLYSDYLTTEGLDVSVAGGSDEALEILEQERPDVIVTDIMMPGMDGVELIRECRRRHPSVEIVVVTALNSVDVAVNALKAGAFDYLVKPVDGESLMFAVERGLENRRVLRENDELRRQITLFQACQRLSVCLEREVFYRLALDSFAEVVPFDAALYVDFEGAGDAFTQKERPADLNANEVDEQVNLEGVEIQADDYDDAPHDEHALEVGVAPASAGVNRDPAPRAAVRLSEAQAEAVTERLVAADLRARSERGDAFALDRSLLPELTVAAQADLGSAGTKAVLPERRSASTDETHGGPPFDDARPLNAGYALAIPVGRGEGVRGAIVLFRTPGHTFDAEDLTQGSFVGRYALFALLNLAKYGDALKLAYRCELTDLWNVRYFRQVLRREMAQTRQAGDPFSVLFVDLDHFKRINDGHGHLIGSKLLQEVARVIVRCVRDVDLVFRYGGDEFTLVLLNTDSAGGMIVGERLRSTIERHHFLGREGMTVRITACVGVASAPQHAETVADLIEMADLAMYQGKKTTRNAVYLASEAFAQAKDDVEADHRAQPGAPK